jgi:spermidine/putrescine transport system permease protein
MLVTFIPALGAYVVPDIVGGPSSEMIGNKIAQRTFVDRNLPQASALSALLALAILAPSMLALMLDRRRRRNGAGKGAAA